MIISFLSLVHFLLLALSKLDNSVEDHFPVSRLLINHEISNSLKLEVRSDWVLTQPAPHSGLALNHHRLRVDSFVPISFQRHRIFNGEE